MRFIILAIQKKSWKQTLNCSISSLNNLKKAFPGDLKLRLYGRSFFFLFVQVAIIIYYNFGLWKKKKIYLSRRGV